MIISKLIQQHTPGHFMILILQQDFISLTMIFQFYGIYNWESQK